MDKIKIMTDTASDISMETAEEYGIHLVPINLTFGTKAVKDKYEISTEEFYDYLSTHDEIPKTTQITAIQHIDEFKKYSDEYAIIYVTISSKGSGTFQSANIAKGEILAENPDADITVIDSMTFSYGYGYWVIEAAKLANAGESKENIVAMLEKNLARNEILFAVDTLEYLQKGGRISPAAKIVANVLDINPILSIKDGLVVNFDKVRGKKKVISKMLSILMQNADPDENQTIAVIHGAAPEKAEKAKQLLLENTNFKNIVTASIGPCIGIHAGPGTIAYSYLKK